MKELIQKIEQWAIDRELDVKGTVNGQSIKTAEEMAELIKGISKDNIDMIKDAIGDVTVTLIVGNMLDNKYDMEVVFKNAEYEYLEMCKGEKINGEKFDEILLVARTIELALLKKYDIPSLNITVLALLGIANAHDLDFKDCVESAYNEIANRKGKLINGQFVKESDL